MNLTQSDITLISSIISAPSFAALFVLLFFQTRKEAHQREVDNAKTIRQLHKHIDKMAELLRRCKITPPEIEEDDE